MLTPGFKLYAGVATFLLAAAVLYAWTSGGVDWNLFPDQIGRLYYEIQGALTGGWRGGVGDHLGYVVLIAGAAGSVTLASVLIAFRDTDAKALAEVAGTPRAPRYRAPGTPSLFAPLAAFGVAVLVLGFVTTRLLWWGGLAVIGLAALEWTVAAWADRATGDDRVNRRIRNRIMNPIEVPVAGLIIIGFVVFGISRVLLAAPKEASVWITIGLAALVFVMAIILTAVPRLTKPLLTAVLGLGIVAILAGGVIGAARGERHFEHDEEHNTYDTTVSTLAGRPQTGIVTTTTTEAGG
jgi:hypothetical protein